MIRILKKNLHTTLIILSIDSISWGKFIHDNHQNYPTPSRLSSTHVSTLCLSIIVSQLTSQSNNVRFHSLSLIYYFCLVQSKVTRASILEWNMTSIAITFVAIVFPKRNTAMWTWFCQSLMSKFPAIAWDYVATFLYIGTLWVEVICHGCLLLFVVPFEIFYDGS